MSSTKEQALLFLEKCDELKKCKFIMATSKIKDILKCIVNSPDLYRLFETVTKDFSYPEYKMKCLVTTDDGIMRKSCVVLPQTVGQRLAFIFCLLVEIDKDTINLNDFLQIYFREDGSYFASYQSFCKNIIGSLEDLIRQVFKEQLALPEPRAEISPSRGNLLSEISLATEEEKRFVSGSALPDEDKENGLKILDALFCAVRDRDVGRIDALICGYNYFVLYNKCVSDGIASLIETLGEFEATL